MKFDDTKVWHAMNIIEQAAVLGFNDVPLSIEDKAKIESLLKRRAIEWDQMRSVKQLDKVA
jgi:hypothetical protein